MATKVVRSLRGDYTGLGLAGCGCGVCGHAIFVHVCGRILFFFCMEGWVGVESDGRSVREGGREGGREVKNFLVGICDC